MPVMSKVEATFCRSRAWRSFTAKVVMPWVLRGEDFVGDVLEIGAGAGANTAVIAAIHPQAAITATDIDPAMVAAARARLARFGRRIAVQQADATRLPFDDDSFDAVVSMLMLHHVLCWEAVIQEVDRVLRPGGRLVGYDLTSTRSARALHLADRSPHRLVDSDELRQELTRAGFVEIAVATGLGRLVARFHAAMPT